MIEVPPDPASDKEEVETRRWLERLAGRNGHASVSHETDVDEVDALRRTILRTAAERLQQDDELALVLTPEHSEHRLQMLLGVMRAQDLLPAPSWWQRLRASAPPRRYAMAATLMAALVLPIVIHMQDPVVYDEPPNFRGGIHVVQRHAADPRQAAESLLHQLQTVGLSASVFQRGKTFFIDVEVPADRLPPGEVVLSVEGLALPMGLTRLEIRTP